MLLHEFYYLPREKNTIRIGNKLINSFLLSIFRQACKVFPVDKECNLVHASSVSAYSFVRQLSKENTLKAYSLKYFQWIAAMFPY